MSAITNIYLIIFLPLLASLFCQLFGKKFFSFWIAAISCLALFFLTLKIIPDILVFEKISNDFELSTLSVALEFRLDILGAIFLPLLIFLKIVILFFYRTDIENTLDEKARRIFYSVYLLHLFALVGIFTTNNLLNLFLFFEIYSFTFFATSSISKNLKISQLSFKYFCLNAVSSLIILFCFLAIYLSFGETDFTKIGEAFAATEKVNDWFLAAIFLLLSLAFIIKFFPFWLYFENLKSINPISSFLSIDSLFIKSNVGIFVMLKFLYFFFGNNLVFSRLEMAPFLIFFALLLIFYSSAKLLQQKHLKTIAAYFCLNNLGFILACLAVQTIESLQALFFYLINFSLVNLLIFIFATFLKRYFKTSSLSKIWMVRKSHLALLLPIKLLIFFIAAFPLSILFFANWYLAYSSFTLDFAAFLLIGLIVSNFAYVSVSIKLIAAFFKEKESSDLPAVGFGFKKYHFYLLSFWFLIGLIYLTSLASNLTNSISMRFASYLLSNTI